MSRLGIRGPQGACAPLAFAAIALPLAYCGGSERSPEAYCKAFYETAAPIREGYVEADEELEDDPLRSIVTLLGSPGDMAVIFDTMAAHAPDEIRVDDYLNQHCPVDSSFAQGIINGSQ